MRTEDLVMTLGNDVRAVPAHAVERRVGVGLSGGAIVTLALVLAWLGYRPDLAEAVLSYPFWMKWGYTISLSLIAISAVVHLSRPEARRPRWLWLAAVPVALLVVLTAVELSTTPADQWDALWTGHSWQVCSMRVTVFSLPIFAGLMWSFRQLAPTRLRLTGAAAGLAAGAFGATLYGLHCPETSALFVLTWYSLGIAVATMIGALTGPRLLRW